MNAILAGFRIIGIAAVTFSLIPAQIFVMYCLPKYFYAIPMLYNRLICRLAGLEISVRGEISQKKPTIFIANHSAYLDIMILSSLVPASFVAKAEIAGWPLFGFLARLQKTIFINRRRRDAAEHVDQVTKALEGGQNLVIFPEGTSGDHNRILPFKPTLFRVADTKIKDAHVWVQPVTISLVGINGLPAGRSDRPYFAWIGDTGLVPHLWQLLQLGCMQIQVQFFPAVHLGQFDNHKIMANHCRTVIATAHSDALSGRKPQDIALNPALTA